MCNIRKMLTSAYSSMASLVGRRYRARYVKSQHGVSALMPLSPHYIKEAMLVLGRIGAALLTVVGVLVFSAITVGIFKIIQFFWL